MSSHPEDREREEREAYAKTLAGQMDAFNAAWRTLWLEIARSFGLPRIVAWFERRRK